MKRNCLVILTVIFSLILMGCMISASGGSDPVIARLDSKQARSESGIILLDPTKEQGAYSDNAAEAR